MHLVGLPQVFTHARMEKAWKTAVRQGLRRQALLDLHDFLDIHRNIKPFIKRLRADVLTGRHRPSEAMYSRLEKKLGISRRIPLPSPADALVLQTVVDVLEPRISRWKPADSAFYTRSHRAPSVEDVDETFSYPWWKLWPQFQQRIWKFTDAFPYIVVTDLANYYDTIPLTSLRHAIAALGKFRQGVLDLLFYMLEAFIWRPEYIPFSGVGLPQLNFDAPRLLAFAYLFPADRYLKKATQANFVRWMDDIDFGVKSVAEGKEILGELDRILNIYGVRLNPAKTTILSAQEAARHFWIQENLKLNIISNSLKHGSSKPHVQARARDLLDNRFAAFYSADRIGHWNKILKRYINLMGQLRDTRLEGEVPKLLRSNPDVRGSIIQYYLNLGFSATRFRQITQYVLSGHCTDDASLFQSCHLIIQWAIPCGSVQAKRSARLAWDLRKKLPTHRAAVAAGIWLMSKYGTSRQLWSFIRRTTTVWLRSEWVARQVAAATPRLTAPQQAQIRREASAAGLLEALHVLTNLEEMRALRILDTQLIWYLNQKSHLPFPYPHGKIIVAINLLKGGLRKQDKDRVEHKLIALTTDTVQHDLLHEANR